jgi:multiple sugar transport system substrate-binding protein
MQDVHSRDRRGLSRRDFLRWSGVAGMSIAGAACSPKEWFGHVGSGLTGTEPAGSGNNLVFSHGPEESGTLVKVIDRFNKENEKGITVEYREMPADSGQYFDKLRTEFQAGGGDIDVMSGDIIWPVQFAANGWIEDLSDLIDEQLRSEYLDAPIEANMYKGKIYGAPWFTDAGMFYYRKDLLEKAGAQPPTTWERVVDIGRKIVDAGDASEGMVFQGAAYEGGVVNGSEYIWSSGGDILARDDLSEVVIDSEPATKGLETERMLVEEGIAPEAVVVYKEQESHTAFLGGDSVFIRIWPYMFGLASDPLISSLKPDQIGVAPIPTVGEGDESFSALGGWNFFINSFSDKKEEAREFITYMSEESTQREFAINAALLPTRKSLYEDKQVLEKQPVVELAKEVTQNARPRPTHPFYSDMSLALAKGFNASLKGVASPTDTVSDLNGELQRLADLGESLFDVG